MKGVFLKVSHLLLAMVISISMMTGCTGGTGSSNESTSNNATTNESTDGKSTSSESEVIAQAPAEISIMLAFDGVEYPQPGNEVQTMMEEYTNTKLDMRPLPGGTLHEMLPVLIASGDMPNVISFGGSQISKPYMQEAFRGGVFWDVAPYISEYPNLSEINPMVFDTYTMNGKIFGLPKLRPIARTGLVYRKDWADTLGLEEPKTVDELYEFLRAFAKDDPDQNGKNDTYGITKHSTAGYFTTMFGAPNGWDIRDGKFIRSNTTEEYLEGLKFYRKLMEEGIMHPEALIMDRAQYEGLFFNGKAGIYENISNFMGYEERVRQADPKAELSAFSAIEGPKGKRMGAGTGHNGIMVMPKPSVKTEEDLKNILHFFDKLGDEKMANLLYYGIEDKHYKVEDGLAVRIPEMTQDFTDNIHLPYAAPMASILPLTNAMKAKLTEEEAKELELNALNEKYAIPNYGINLHSETAIARGATLDQILKDAEQKFILGAIDEEGYKKEIQRWRDSGGDKIAEELATSYAENKK